MNGTATAVEVIHDATFKASAAMEGMRCKEMWPDRTERVGMLFIAPELSRLWVVWNDSLTCLNDLFTAFRDGAFEVGWLAIADGGVYALTMEKYADNKEADDLLHTYAKQLAPISFLNGRRHGVI